MQFVCPGNLIHENSSTEECVGGISKRKQRVLKHCKHYVNKCSTSFNASNICDTMPFSVLALRCVYKIVKIRKTTCIAFVTNENDLHKVLLHAISKWAMELEKGHCQIPFRWCLNARKWCNTCNNVRVRFDIHYNCIHLRASHFINIADNW